MITRNVYLVPLPEDLITWIVKDELLHVGAYKNSIDYAVPIGTPVYAAADGIVDRVRDDSGKYGNDPKYGPDVNYLGLLHANNELSEYLHLKKHSALVKVGDKVKAGQQIAVTGLSGWLT